MLHFGPLLGKKTYDYFWNKKCIIVHFIELSKISSVDNVKFYFDLLFI